MKIIILILTQFLFCYYASNLQHDILIEFHHSLNGQNWINNWNITDNQVCNYYGVFCDSRESVIGIGLSNNNLYGYVPPSFKNLTNLNNLDLSNNRIYGEVILGKVSTVTLSYNDINYVRVDADRCILNDNNINQFDFMGKLPYLNLDNNKITVFNNSIVNVPNIISLRGNTMDYINSVGGAGSSIDIDGSLVDTIEAYIPNYYGYFNGEYSIIKNIKLYSANNANYWTDIECKNIILNIANASFSNINSLLINETVYYNECYCNGKSNCYYQSCNYYYRECKYLREYTLIGANINSFKYINTAKNYYDLTTRLFLNKSYVNTFELEVIGTIELYAPNAIINYANLSGSINCNIIYGYNYQYTAFTTKTNIITAIFNNSQINNITIMCGLTCSFKNTTINTINIYYLYNPDPNYQNLNVHNIDLSNSNININNVTTFSYQLGNRYSYSNTAYYTTINNYISQNSKGLNLTIFAIINNLDLSSSKFNNLNLTLPSSCCNRDMPPYNNPYQSYQAIHNISNCKIDNIIYNNIYSQQTIFDNSTIKNLQAQVYGSNNVTFFNSNINNFIGIITANLYFNNFTSENTSLQTTGKQINITNSQINTINITTIGSPTITINNVTAKNINLHNNCGNISLLNFYAETINYANNCTESIHNTTIQNLHATNIKINASGTISATKIITNSFNLSGSISNLKLSLNSTNLIIEDTGKKCNFLNIENSTINTSTINLNCTNISINIVNFRHLVTTIYSTTITILKLKITVNDFIKLTNTVELYGKDITLDTDISLVSSLNPSIQLLSLENAGLNGVLPLSKIPFMNLQENYISWNYLYTEIKASQVSTAYINKFYKNDTIILISSLGNIVFVTERSKQQLTRKLF
jgi:hypothetical protein